MIYIITTGGTIGGLDYGKDENKYENVVVNINKFLITAGVTSAFEVKQLLNKDSRHLTGQDRHSIAQKVKDLAGDKVLITHGTMTMVETAKYLGGLGLKKTIVLVGSFVLGTNKNTDAPFNLGYAFYAVQALSFGVYIAMHGKVFPWNTVVKNQEKNQFENIS